MSIALSLMVAVRVWTWIGPSWAHPFTGPLAAALLVLLAGSPPASIGDLRYALAGVLIIATAFGLALLIPRARRALAEPYFPTPWRTALLEIPLATVIFEEVAFRGVLWTLIEQAHGHVWATLITALLFGLWHISPDPDGRPQLLIVAFTTMAGLVLGLLRDLSGGLLAPIAVHWAANGLGVLTSMAARRRTRKGS
ncbi:CPBP family intramembrane glutamic endopeptidase [Actinoplanes sp. NPDC023714]|uniref:CPBP family intramembrane glutamic endopeptidase n=1 Tax=Actinoplanes sp. NPDC023714 TaxID=3154322 RepID=UPI0033F49EEB